jgi:4-hydroxybenzoate polyprenyltransferase
MKARISSIVRAFLDFVLFSNIFIALCSVAQAMVTYQLLDVKPQKHILALLFFATLAQYNFSILLSKPKNPQESRFRRVRWIFSHYRLMISLTIVSILSLIPLILFLSIPSQILLFFIGVLSVAYALPIFSLHDKKFGLRNIPGIKLFLIALVWSLSTVLLPILELDSSTVFYISSSDTILLVAKRFLFVAAITIPFDIRDLFQDKSSALKTIPVMLGEKNAYLFCQALLGAYLVLLFLFRESFDKNFFALTLTIVLSGWLIFKSNFLKNEYYYFLYLDGTLILQFLMLLLVNSLPV